MPSVLTRPRSLPLGLLWLCLLAGWCVGIFGRGYWTPDEPREADLAWRMSWQADKAVPLLAGEAFCEKPPLTYWLAAGPIALWGPVPWAARLPNLLYALVTAAGMYGLARRGAGVLAGAAAAAILGSFLLSYQVLIWLATDAPLLAATSVALLGLYWGFHAAGSRDRLWGYSLMHAALAAGFLSKSAVAWMVPGLALCVLIVWERRWREVLRWELYAGFVLQAAAILTWVTYVYSGADGVARLKIFFWNNLVGRFTQVDAPSALQYAGGHRNSPGKYLLELPVYLWPWPLLVIAAVAHAWRRRHAPPAQLRPLRFAFAATLPALLVLSVAQTARNVYFAPALPGIALLLGWWIADQTSADNPWDHRALRATAGLLLLAAIVLAAAVLLVGFDSWPTMQGHTIFVTVSTAGILSSSGCAITSLRAAGRRQRVPAAYALVMANCLLMIGPMSQIYGRVDTWQDLAAVGRAIGQDAIGRSLILYTPDETTRAMIDLWARDSVQLIPAPADAGSAGRLQAFLALEPKAMVVAQMPGRDAGTLLREWRRRHGSGIPDELANVPAPEWAKASGLRIIGRYSLPNGRRYALLDMSRETP